MSGSVSNDKNIELFKTVYGEMHDLVPDDQIFAKDIPFNQKQRVGSKFVEDVVLGDEVGITFGGSGQEAFEIDSAIAGAVKQTEVTPYVTILPSLLPLATISRSNGSEQAFMQASRFVVKNNLASHNRFLEVTRVYGQSSDLLGYVSFATATYRGVAFTAGTGTLNGITFTNGVNAAGKYILLAPGSFASGIWVGKKGVKVLQVDSTGTVLAAGKLVGVNSAGGYMQVDFTPVAPSAETGAGSVRLAYKGYDQQQEAVGIHKILNTNGVLFNIDNSKYELFRGNQIDLQKTKLTLSKVTTILADAVNGGGLDGDVTLYCNPRSWSTFANTEAGLRVYDKSYTASKAENGFMDLEFYTQTGKITVKAHRVIKEGDAAILKLDTWSRSGSAQVGFKVPGMDSAGEMIKLLDNQAGYQFKSYADEYVFTYAPAMNVWIKGINDEAAS